MPSEIMFTVRELIVATPRDEPHDKNKSPLTETHSTPKRLNTRADTHSAKRQTTLKYNLVANVSQCIAPKAMETQREQGTHRATKSQNDVPNDTMINVSMPRKSACDTTPNSRVDQTHKQHALPSGTMYIRHGHHPNTL